MQYDTIIQNALNNNIKVLGLFSNECVPAGQNVFNDDPDGDGMNQYVLDYKATVLLLVDRYKIENQAMGNLERAERVDQLELSERSEERRRDVHSSAYLRESAGRVVQAV